jgi:hypothetical protein
MPQIDVNAMLAERAREQGTDDLEVVIGPRSFPLRPVIPTAAWERAVEALPDEVGTKALQDKFTDAVLGLLDDLVTEHADEVRSEWAKVGDFALASQMFAGIVEAYTGRPTPPASASDDGRQGTTASTKKAKSSAPSAGRGSKSKRSATASAASAA